MATANAMAFWDFEPDPLRIVRNVEGFQYRLQQGFQQNVVQPLQQQGLGAITGAPGGLVGGLASLAGGGLGAIGRATEGPRDLAGQALDVALRPGRGFRGQLAYAAEGKNPLEGWWQGMYGGAPVPGPWGPTVPELPEEIGSGYAGVFERHGMPTAPVGPFDTRGIAGFAADVALDPLTYIPGANIGKVARMAQAARAAPALGGAATAAPRVLSAAGVEPAFERIMQPTRVAQATAAASKAPVVGWGIKKTANLISDNILAHTDPTKVRPAVNAYLQNVDRMSSIARGTAAQLRGMPTATKFNAEGRMLLRRPDGSTYYHAAGDVFENPAAFAADLAPEDAAIIRSQHALTDDMQRLWREDWEALNVVAPEQARHFTLGKAVELEEGAHYSPRYAVKDGMPHFEQPKPAGAVGPSHYMPRKFAKQEEAIAGGENYLNPLQAEERYIYDLSMERAQMQFGKLLKEQGIADALDQDSLRNLDAMRNKAKMDLRADPKNKALVEVVKLAEQNYTAARAGHKPVLDGLLETSAAYLKGLWFEPDVARQLSARLIEQPNAAIREIGDIAGISRTMQTTFDFGGPMIQGLVALVAKPDAFLKAYVQSLKSWADAGVTERYLGSEKAQRVMQATGGGLRLGSEQMEMLDPLRRAAAGQGMSAGERAVAGLERLPVLGTGWPQGRLNLVGRFQRSFDTFGDVLRIEWADALLPTAQRMGGQQAVAEMVDFVNHATGVTSTVGMGINPTQRAVESMLLFAPRYTRSALALVGDLLNGGMAAQQAQKTFAQLLSVGVMEYARVAQVLGQEPELDPSKPGFLTVVIPGTDERVGPGGVWVSLARMLAKMNDPELAGQATDISDPTNPLVRFFRARTGPATGSAWDLVMHESYMGEPLNTAGDYAKYFGSRFLPMSIAGVFVDSGSGGRPMEPGEVATELGGTFLGFRTFPRGFSEMREATAQEQYGKPYEQLNPSEQVRVQQAPEVKEIPLPQGQRYTSLREREDVFERYRGSVNQLAAEVDAGRITKPRFRELVNQQNADLQIRLGEIEETGPPGKPKAARDVARDKYYELLKTRDIEGRPDFEAAESYLASLSTADRQYIEDRQRASYLRLDDRGQRLMDELWQARKLTKPYWEIKDNVQKRMGLAKPWNDATQAERERLADTPRFRTADRIERREKESYRRSHRTVDRALVEWWGHVGINERQTGRTGPALPRVPSLTR